MPSYSLAYTLDSVRQFSLSALWSSKNEKDQQIIFLFRWCCLPLDTVKYCQLKQIIHIHGNVGLQTIKKYSLSISFFIQTSSFLCTWSLLSTVYFSRPWLSFFSSSVLLKTLTKFFLFCHPLLINSCNNINAYTANHM